MARKIKASRISSRSTRVAFPIRQKPYDYTPVAPGISIGYRRTKSAGSWVVRVADGKGGSNIWNIGIADDFEDADGSRVLDYWQASKKAQREGAGTSVTQPATFATALDAYADKLRTEGGNPGNASVVRLHLQDYPGLLNKQVAELITKELTHWRNDLVKNGMKIATVNRVMKSAKACLTYAAKQDPRIRNRNAWKDGLGLLKDDTPQVKRVLENEADVRALVQGAYALREDFGLFTDLLATTGTRTSQACRLTVDDLKLGDNGTPKLSIPRSKKGKKKQSADTLVPIPPALAAKLKLVAKDKPGHAPLLTQADGSPWNPEAALLWKLFNDIPGRAEIAERNEIHVTAYSLRHSSIVRMLLRGVPIRVVAVMHDTGVTQIESTYSAFIGDHSDALVRAVMLDTSGPNENNVIPLRG
jgi:integrase